MSRLLSRMRARFVRRRWRFGDFARTVPISRSFGFDRGTPIDRHYIERFLANRSADIRGYTLEIGDDSYTRRFGGAAVTKSEILHLDNSARADHHGDLASAGTLPEGRFDCAIVTQTLHLIWDMAAAMRQLHASLRPGGCLLLTVPGISQIADDRWSETWFWSLTPLSARHLAAHAFGPDRVEVTAFGNVFAASAFLQGLAVEDVNAALLEPRDAAYPVTIAIRAVRE